MLKIVRSMKELPFGQLMEIYCESYDAVSQQDFYDYLRSDFFQTDGAVYCLWLEKHRAVCALRLEPWRDGVLLTGLETAPVYRRCGFASSLVTSVLTELRRLGPVKVYSHVHKRNAASIRVHEKCGFGKISDTAVYLSGSADSCGATYLYDLQ